MNGDAALELLGELLRTGLLLCLPLLGLVVGVLQGVTLQEPPIAVLVLALLAPWMLGRLTAYAVSVFTCIPRLA